MTAQTLDGKAFAARLRARIATQVADLAGQGIVPGLVVVLVLLSLVTFGLTVRGALRRDPDGDPDAETWVRQRTLAILQGNAIQVAAGIRRRDRRGNSHVCGGPATGGRAAGSDAGVPQHAEREPGR